MLQEGAGYADSNAWLETMPYTCTMIHTDVISASVAAHVRNIIITENKHQTMISMRDERIEIYVGIID